MSSIAATRYSPRGAEVAYEIGASSLAMPTSTDNYRIDHRDKVQHMKEDPHFIAEYLAQNTSKAAAVFRRYDKLAMFRIIRLSKELRDLEHKHDEIIETGHNREDPGLYADFEDQVSKKIKEYYDLLNAYSQVLHLEPPAGRTVEALDRYIGNPFAHNKQEWWAHRLRYTLRGSIRERTYPDLVSLYTPAENDYLSKFVDKFLYPFFTTPESTKDAKYVNEQKLQRFVTLSGTVFAIGFLIAAMWVLWRLKDNMIAKLGTVTGFVVAFAAWLGFLTTAQRKDVISATAAYAAVLVVFVSQQNS